MRLLYASGGALGGVLAGLLSCGVLFAVLGIGGGFGVVGALVCALLGGAGARLAWRASGAVARGPRAGRGWSVTRRLGVLLAAVPSGLLVAAGDWPAVLGAIGVLGTALPLVIAHQGWFRHAALSCAVGVGVVGLAYAGAYGAGLPLVATAAVLALTGASGPRVAGSGGPEQR